MTPESTMPPVEEGAKRPAAVQRRSRLHYLYYLLAAFDLITVTLSLLLINQVAGSFEESVEVNELWARRINDFAELSRLAAAVNAPGNDVFETRDLNSEAARFTHALEEFEAQAGVVRTRILALEEAERAELLAAFAAVTTAMAEMVTESNTIFSALAEDDLARAGEHMAAMDRAYLAVNFALADVTGQAQAIQEDHLARSAERAAAVRRSEWLIAGLIVLMIAGVTVYGARLARQARQQAQITEALVVERTRQLEESHQRLRTAERLASIGTLAAGLGHDMNNVLFPVRCRLDVLDQANLGEGPSAELRSVRSSLEFLQQLSDGLRLLSIDPDREGESGATTALGPWSRQVEPLLRTTLAKDVALAIDVRDELPAVAIAPHQLTQAVFNLVVNAGEAIEGPGRVTISAAFDSRENSVCISVTDTGQGMTEDVRRQALDPFFTTKTRALSTGLGLALVHGIASGAGGSVRIDSAPETGTTVSILLPAVSARKPVPGRVAARPRAIVSLSDERMGSFMANVLMARGWEIEQATSLGSAASPADANAWIVSPSAASPGEADAFLAGGRGRRIILACDEVPEEWDMPGVLPLRAGLGLPAAMAVANALAAASRDWAEAEEGAA